MAEIVFTHHAEQRLRERWGLSRIDGERELRESFEGSRHSPRLPGFVRYSGRNADRRSKGEKMRFAWDEARARCYVLVGKRVRSRERRGGYVDGWIVKTVLAAAENP